MKATLAAVALACLAHGAVTTPRDEASTPSKEGKAFTLDQTRNENFQGHDLPLAMIKAHLKFGQPLPPQMTRAISLNADLKSKYLALTEKNGGGTQKGTVQAIPATFVDSEYVVTAGIGTPPQNLALNLDTGSADLWVFSTDTQTTQVGAQQIYSPGSSSTSRLLRGERWSIRYGDGAAATGVVYTDRVQLGAAFVKNQAVESALQVTPDLTADNFVSGILGMAHSSANFVRPTKQRSFIDNIKNDLALPLFTANLRARRPGNFNFGYINSSEFTGRVQYTGINPSSALWDIGVSGYKIGKQSYVQSPWNAIVDTGTSLLLAPENIVKSYYAQFPGAVMDPNYGVMTFPCAQQPPDFWFGIGDYRGFVPGKYFLYGKINDTYCYGGIQSSGPIGFGVLGDVVLKAQFVVFEYGSGQVGFANKNLDI